jgi:O-acetylserine/cysteine efflux transporter
VDGVSPRHLLLALGLAVVWGVNFVVIEAGLAHFPPLLFCALRFLVAAVPAIFFLRSPGVPWRWVALVAATLGIGQFGLLFSGMAAGMPPGLSSLVLQAQAPFTLLFAVLLLKERLTRRQLTGMAIALAGIALIAVDLGATSPFGAFLLLLGAAAMWGVGNVVVRHARPPDMLRFMVWVSALAALPLFAMSAVFEGRWDTLASVPWSAIGAVFYVGLLATVAGFGVWGLLIRTYSASAIAPFSLLVPVFGMAAAAVFTGERVTPAQIVAGVLVLSGVLVGLGQAAARSAPAMIPASTSG